MAGLQGEDVIAILPWEEWWEFEVTKDDSNPQIALLPLHPDLRAKFNETAAWIYAKSMDGKPYGYHNMIFSWIDTISDNYPPPLDAHVVWFYMYSFEDHFTAKPGYICAVYLVLCVTVA
jgi:hypothetical protein